MTRDPVRRRLVAALLTVPAAFAHPDSLEAARATGRAAPTVPFQVLDNRVFVDVRVNRPIHRRFEPARSSP